MQTLRDCGPQRLFSCRHPSPGSAQLERNTFRCLLWLFFLHAVDVHCPHAHFFGKTLIAIILYPNLEHMNSCYTDLYLYQRQTRVKVWSENLISVFWFYEHYCSFWGFYLYISCMSPLWWISHTIGCSHLLTPTQSAVWQNKPVFFHIFLGHRSRSHRECFFLPCLISECRLMIPLPLSDIFHTRRRPIPHCNTHFHVCRCTWHAHCTSSQAVTNDLSSFYLFWIHTAITGHCGAVTGLTINAPPCMCVRNCSLI